MKNIKYIFLLLISAIFITSCKSDAEKKSKDELNKLETFIQENYPDATKTSSGLYIVWNEHGTGKAVVTGNYINVTYVGKFLDGGIFDASANHNGTFQFYVGQGNVIRAWDQAVQQCKIGDKITLITPSSMAYGSMGNGTIPPYTSLVFDIDILEILSK